MSVHCSGVPTRVDWFEQTGLADRHSKEDPTVFAHSHRLEVSRLVLLTSSALVLLAVAVYSPATHAQIVIDQDGVAGPDGADVIGDADADNGQPGGNATHTNNADATTAGTAFLGTAKGGRGGDGGTAISITVIPIPPFLDVTLDGGNGGNGGNGGVVDITNTATLQSSNNNADAMTANASGGNGGNGAWAFHPLTSDGGVGGRGGNGGTATLTTTVTSNITTFGNVSNGISAIADGGNGGNGGTALGGVGSGTGGNGGAGGFGGTASATNAGTIVTHGVHSKGMLVRSAGGVGGDGASGAGLIDGEGGNGGVPTVGGNATGTNSGTIDTFGDFANGMVVQSIGGGGGDGGGAFGVFGGGGSGAAGNNGAAATGTNTGTISTRGTGAIGMLVESIGGGGGDGGGAIGSRALGGDGGGGGNGATATGHLGGTIRTGFDDNGGDGAHGIVIQSIGGGGGNGGFAISGGPVVAVGVGGNGATGGNGGTVDVQQAASGPIVETKGTSAIGILAQSVGGGGGNGGGSYSVSAGVSVSIGGKGAAGGDGAAVTYNVGNANVTTHGADSSGIMVQSIGGGGGNGGFSLALAAGASIGIGGSGGAGGDAGTVTVTSGGSVFTQQDRSAGIIAQSIGGGGGNGGGSVSGSLGFNIGVGGKGTGGGVSNTVSLTNSAAVTTQGIQSHALLAQSIGGGGGSGGFSVSGGGPAVAIGGDGGAAGSSRRVYVSNTGTLSTDKDLSIGLFAQSVGGSGGDGGFSIAGGAFAAIGVGGAGGGGGNGGSVDDINAVEVHNNANITTRGALAHGILAQSVGGGGGNGGSTGAFAVGLFGAAGVAVGGGGGAGRDGFKVDVTHAGNITVSGMGAKAIVAQSIGGGGGNGGNAYSGAVSVGLYVSAGVGVSIGGGGGVGGSAGEVVLRADGNLIADTGPPDVGEIVADHNAIGTGGIVAQSIGGSGGNGGRAVSVAGSLSTGASINLGVSVGGGGGGGGLGRAVTVETGLVSGGLIVTQGYQAAGIMAQSIGGGGGSGGDSWSGAGGFGVSATVSATVTIGGPSGNGNESGAVRVTNAMSVLTHGDQSSAIVAQSIGGGGGNGGSSSGATASLGGGSGVNVDANVSVGAVGGDGNLGNTVDVTNTGNLTTKGYFSSGIYAQSIGGGGGSGGSSNAKAFNVGGTASTNVSAKLAVGGAGGDGNDARKVTVNNSGVISTSGFGSTGIVAMSVGGGGGGAGSAGVGDEAVLDPGGDSGSTSVSVGAAIGLAGGGAGNGGEIDITNSGSIFTNGADSFGISANSIGGGGGIGGSASAGATAEYAIGGALGGVGGSAGNGGVVTVRNTSTGAIITQRERSLGIFAQSIGGGGGVGGAGQSTGGDGGTVNLQMSLGGSGEAGGNGDAVTVDNAGLIWTQRENSHGVMAQSIGGSGGLGGASGSATADETQYALAFSLGGAGGNGGFGGSVTVTNRDTGLIFTDADNSYGVFAQSIGGGGGSAGGGSTTAGVSDLSVNLAIGGAAGGGNYGGTVRVDNFGQIITQGALSHGIYAQSIGGGGGASGAAANASEAETAIGGTFSLAGGGGADGGHVIVNNAGYIETFRAGALGIFAQSVGGGGGYGGVVSDDTAVASAFGLQVGGFGGDGGNGGAVDVTVSGAIITHGERAHGVVAQSVGGGGGYGGDANGKVANSLAIGGIGGEGGNGGDVTVTRTGTITTTGKDSIAIIAQSVGGGGGFGGAGFGRFETEGDGSAPDSIGFNSPTGGIGTGGTVTIIQTGAIETSGDRAHGIVAQAVGGGGGMGGTSSLALGQSAAGSQGGTGNAAAVGATANSEVWIKGASAYALFGQSATGNGTAGAVDLIAHNSLFARGADSVAAYGESSASGAKGNITLTLNGAYTIGGSASGVAAMLVGGQNNNIVNHSLMFAMGITAPEVGQTVATVPNGVLETYLGQFSPLTMSGTFGNDNFDNVTGRVIGNLEFGDGSNGFHNFSGASMVGLSYIGLHDGTFLNDGLMSNQGIGVRAVVDIASSYTQSLSGLLVVDVDLDAQTTDMLTISDAGDFNGTAPLNFLTIDKLFEEYAVANAVTIVNSGIEATTLHPTVGFLFQFRVDDVPGGQNLVLFADKPTFVSLIQDPASGVDDPGVFDMAEYFDAVEAASSPDNPMARLINMLRFLPDEETLGETLTRLTPHYAVHTFDMLNRSTDVLLDNAWGCSDVRGPFDAGGRCIWATINPDDRYERETGPNATLRDDTLKTMSAGVIAEVSTKWSLGLAIGRTEYDSEITFKDEWLSTNKGESWQAFGLAKFVSGNWFVDIAAGGGTGRFDGTRNTRVDQVAMIPGELVDGQYLPEVLLEGIGNSVEFSQTTAQVGASARIGYNHYAGKFYMQPNVQLDARWLRVEGTETGSLAAINFDGSSNGFYAATPGIEIGAQIPIGATASLRAFAKAGVQFSTDEWTIEGQFAATEGLIDEQLELQQAIDTPLYRVGAGLELDGVQGVGLVLKYSGAFGEAVDSHSIGTGLKVRF
ncbi:autotransporter outer membrane beta-barrel domain-containing protein [Mesorhizobium sp. KR9-304]|uniref:autotransporter outer membrane beta-barrel domain-containing protein n=1 Tax=Mesorhizobium sp. KR9-304 TaxID=3156614 RepID=UPI0032B3DE3F